MAKVIIEITRDFTGKNGDVVSEMIGTKVSVTEISPKDESGPQDALAYIVAHKLPVLLKLAGKQLAEDMTKNGATAFCHAVGRTMN
ncbi:hypothetical protein EX075_13940 [Salmonella enterica]|nr:hypothetical protein [Salmonella enterica]EGK9673219.1 hypothetical protein [Salmonella enterica]